LNFARFAFYFLLANFFPARLQAFADRQYEHERRVAEGGPVDIWLLGLDPPRYLELRSAEYCPLCRRETFIAEQ